MASSSITATGTSYLISRWLPQTIVSFIINYNLYKLTMTQAFYIHSVFKVGSVLLSWVKHDIFI